jgi:hypothetical protein
MNRGLRSRSRPAVLLSAQHRDVSLLSIGMDDLPVKRREPHDSILAQEQREWFFAWASIPAISQLNAMASRKD